MRSDNVTKDVEHAPDHSLFYALGYTEEELECPLVGVVCSYNGIVPDHMNLGKVAEAIRAGVRAADSTPVKFPAIAVCDGITVGHAGMKYSLVTRDLVADSTEAMVVAHQSDDLVMIPSCDKSMPSLLMTAARVNVLTIFCSSDPMLAGRLGDGRRSCLSCVFEAVGVYKASRLDEAGMKNYENSACPTHGSCSGMYTANSMNCFTGTIGMDLRDSGTISAVWLARLRLIKHAGMQITDLMAKNIRPRDIMTPAAFYNAETVSMALGYSINTMLHLPVITHECGIKLDLGLPNEISSKTPNLCHLAPAGDTYIEDLEGADGMYAVIKELTKKGLLDTSVLTCTGKTLTESLGDVVDRDPELVCSIENPYSADGGITVLEGNLAPEGCVMKRPAVTPEMMLHTGPAQVFNSEEEAITAICAGKVVPGDMVVIRYEGPKGGPGMREMLNPTSTIYDMGLGKSAALITDGHSPGVARGASIGHVCPEAAQGSPIGLVERGNIISIDIPACKIELQVDEATLAARRARWIYLELRIKIGYLARYAKLVTSTARGAVLK